MRPGSTFVLPFGIYFLLFFPSSFFLNLGTRFLDCREAQNRG